MPTSTSAARPASAPSTAGSVPPSTGLRPGLRLRPRRQEPRPRLPGPDAGAGPRPARRRHRRRDRTGPGPARFPHCPASPANSRAAPHGAALFLAGQDKRPFEAGRRRLASPQKVGGANDCDFDAWLDFMFGRPARSEFYPSSTSGRSLGPAPAVASTISRGCSRRPCRCCATIATGRSAAACGCSPARNRTLCTAAKCRSRRARALRRRHLPLVRGPLRSALRAGARPSRRPGAGAFNATCYMWWENLPFVAATDDPDKDRLDARVIDVLEKVLGLANPACQESALHRSRPSRPPRAAACRPSLRRLSRAQRHPARAGRLCARGP